MLRKNLTRLRDPDIDSQDIDSGLVEHHHKLPIVLKYPLTSE